MRTGSGTEGGGPAPTPNRDDASRVKSYFGDRLRNLVKRYFALPAPMILPSGIRNQWILKVHPFASVDEAAATAGSNRDSTSTLQPAPDRITLTLYDIVKDCDALPRADAVLLYLSDDLTPGAMPSGKIAQPPRTAQERVMGDASDPKVKWKADIHSTSVRIAFACIEAIFYHFCNVQTDDRVPNGKATKPLLNVLPPLGTFRPMAIFFFDNALLDMVFEILNCVMDNPKVFLGRNAPLQVQPPSSSTVPPRFEQMLVVCNQCRGAGVDRSGAAVRKQLLRCGRCQMSW